MALHTDNRFAREQLEMPFCLYALNDNAIAEIVYMIKQRIEGIAIAIFPEEVSAGFDIFKQAAG